MIAAAGYKPNLLDRVLNPGMRRLAKAELRRHKGRTALIFLLVVVASTLSLVANEAADDGLKTDENAMGLIARDDTAAEKLLDHLQPEHATLWNSSYASGRRLSDQGLLHGLSDNELRNRPVGPNQEYVLIEGVAPVGPNEIVADVVTAERLGWEIGGTPTISGQQRLVTGIAQGLGFSEGVIFVPPGLLPDGQVVGNVWFADAKAVRAIQATDPAAAQGLSAVAGVDRVDMHGNEGLAATAFFSFVLMAAAATISAAAWSVGFKRRLRDVALANVIGAEPAHLRRSVALQALWISIAAFVGGWALSITGTALYNRFRDPFASPLRAAGLLTIVIAGLIIIGMSLIAAWLPVRSLKLESVTSGLAGRTSNRTAALRTLLGGAGLGAIGLILLDQSADRDEWPALALGVLGSTAIMAGTAIALPWILEQTAAFSTRSVNLRSPSARLALRDLASSRQRTVSLIMVIGTVATLTTVALVDEKQHHLQDAQAQLDNRNVGQEFWVRFGLTDAPSDVQAAEYIALEKLDPISIAIAEGDSALASEEPRTITQAERGALSGEGLVGIMRFESDKRIALEALELSGIEIAPGYQVRGSAIRPILLSAFIVLTVVLVLLGLTRRSEDGEKRAAMYALGAAPHSYRSNAMWSGVAAGVVSVGIAIPLGVTVHATVESGYPRFTIPWLAMAGLALAIPLLVGAIGAAVTPGPTRSRAQWLDRQVFS